MKSNRHNTNIPPTSSLRGAKRRGNPVCFIRRYAPLCSWRWGADGCFTFFPPLYPGREPMAFVHGASYSAGIVFFFSRTCSSS
jgi:hypothetical protein